MRLDVFVADERGPRRTVVHGFEDGEVVARAREETGL
jgi:hypothetical protein